MTGWSAERHVGRASLDFKVRMSKRCQRMTASSLSFIRLQPNTKRIGRGRNEPREGFIRSDKEYRRRGRSLRARARDAQDSTDQRPTRPGENRVGARACEATR